MARTRSRIGLSYSPTITTGKNLVSANRTEEIIGMNTDLEADNAEQESEDTEDLEVEDTEEETDDTEALEVNDTKGESEDIEDKSQKIEDGDNVEASMEEIED